MARGGAFRVNRVSRAKTVNTKTRDETCITAINRLRLKECQEEWLNSKVMKAKQTFGDYVFEYVFWRILGVKTSQFSVKDMCAMVLQGDRMSLPKLNFRPSSP
jgi:hypothetical protein